MREARQEPAKEKKDNDKDYQASEEFKIPTATASFAVAIIIAGITSPARGITPERHRQKCNDDYEYNDED